jgi:glycosyltransferase involved in cell wall biosynthesis
MNILVISHNPSLRSTTCILDAAVNQFPQRGINMMFCFSHHGPWADELKTKGFKCSIQPFNTPDKNSPFKLIHHVWKWMKIIRQSKADYVHCNEHDNYPMIRHACYLLGIKVVVGVHFIIKNGFASWAFGGRFKPTILLYTSQYQLDESLPYLPPEFAKDNLVMAGFGRDFTSMTSADSKSSYRTLFDTEAIIIGTASAIRPRKRIEDFVSLIARLRESGHNVKGIVAGGGQYADPTYYANLEKQIDELGLINHCKMLGNVDHMPDFYRSLDIFVSTSEMESFGMSVCEAMAFAVPTVGYSGGSVREVIGNNWCTTDDVNLPELLKKVETLLIEKEFAIELGKTQKERVMDNFDTPQLAGKLEQVYNSLSLAAK